MTHRHGYAPTAHASLYLKKLCRHFSHKVDTEFDDSRGIIRFPFGTCELYAQPEALHLHCQAGEDNVEKLQSVIDSHLLRFASKETLTLVWQ